MKFGIHLALGNVIPAAVVQAAQRAEAMGFDFISVFDHLHSANGSREEHSLEATATHALLAASTKRIQVGCLVYCCGYRYPGVLAKSISTIDAISNGRSVLGLGAGWNKREYKAFGLPFLETRQRLAQLEEYTECLRRLTDGERLKFEGDHYNFADAACFPVPVQQRLPIWLGGLGERHLIRIAATYGDGWNAPYVTPEVFSQKFEILAKHCDNVGRDLTEIVTSVNVPLARDEEDLKSQFGKFAGRMREVAILLDDGDVAKAVEGFEKADCHLINFALRSAPDNSGHYDYEALESLGSQLGLAG